MPFICIGPVCIPFNIAIPALLLVAMPIWNRLPDRWRLAIEKRWNQLLDAFYRTFPALDKRRHKKLDKSRGTEHVSLASDQIDGNAGKVIPVDSMESWEAVLSRARELNVKVVVKFGAEWCKPCKWIAPAYESIAAAYAGSCIFCVVDVDEVEDLALEYSASMLPTFQVLGADGAPLQSMAGADEGRLRQMLAENLGTAK